MTERKRRRQIIRWKGNAYQLWIEHGGRYSLRQSVNRIAPRWATPSDEQRLTADLIAEGRVIYEAIMEAIGKV